MHIQGTDLVRGVLWGALYQQASYLSKQASRTESHAPAHETPGALVYATLRHGSLIAITLLVLAHPLVRTLATYLLMTMV